MPNPTAAMLVIGDEILSGRTRDSNLHVLSRRLSEVGIDLREARVVPDTVASISEAVNQLRSRYDHVFTSGGIGPTHDDITSDAIARAFGVALDVREDALQALITAYPGGRKDLNPERRRMARIPDGADLIANPVSGAPGYSIENVHVMAGVPAVFEAMLGGLLAGLDGGQPLLAKSVRIERPEGEIANDLGKIARDFPQVSIGSYPYYGDGIPGSNVVVRGTDQASVRQASARVRRLAVPREQ